MFDKSYRLMWARSKERSQRPELAVKGIANSIYRQHTTACVRTQSSNVNDGRLYGLPCLAIVEAVKDSGLSLGAIISPSDQAPTDGSHARESRYSFAG